MFKNKIQLKIKHKLKRFIKKKKIYKFCKIFTLI